jgi:hypothetical protein
MVVLALKLVHHIVSTVADGPDTFRRRCSCGWKSAVSYRPTAVGREEAQRETELHWARVSCRSAGHWEML